MRAILLILALMVAAPAMAREVNLSTEALVDQLTQVDSNVPGADATGVFDDFMATEKPPRMQMGLLGENAPVVPAAMRELVRRGVSALPVLLRHLQDNRLTRLKIVNDDLSTVGGTYFANEYDPRFASAAPCGQPCGEQDAIHGTYTLKVGDFCYVLVGQIVNRSLYAMRYQPSMIVMVNSPVHLPILAEETRRDWSGLTNAALLASLLDDLHDESRPWLRDSALERLRFYYSGAYTSLRGKDAELRAEFEAGEKKN